MNERVVTDTVHAERLEIIRSAAALAAVGPAWDALWGRLDGLIFQSHSWLTAWWNTVPDQSKRSLRIGLIWNGDTLVAAMPLAISRRKGLRFLEWAAASYTDYGDVLVAPECPDHALLRLWDELCGLGGFDLVYLSRLLPDAGARKLERRGGTSLHLNHRQEMSYRVKGEWQSGKQWFDAQSKKARQNYRRSAKAIEQAGGYTFRLLEPDAPLHPVLKRFAMLKRQWLRHKGLQSPLFAEDSTALAALVAAMAEARILRIFVVECQDVIIAISINFVQRDTMMAFVTTYDPAFERTSPGAVLIANYIQWSFNHDLKTVDFLCGAEPFKNRFATHSVCLTSLIAAGSIKGRMALAVDWSRHAVQEVRSRRPAAVKTTAASIGRQQGHRAD